MIEKTIIIAEAGVNHNGDLDYALRLVDAAADAGADYVKFQTFNASQLVSADAKKANYQIENTNETESQLEMLKRLELSADQHNKIISYCEQRNIKFFSTAFDEALLQYLADVGLDVVKIPSGEITNLPYLRKAATLFKRVILSTGMSTINDIRLALRVFTDSGISKEDITILHCNTEYPTPLEDVNLKAMLHIQKKFKTSVGYSDHTLGIEVPIAAVALGARVIEKHFTLDKSLYGPDHKASLDPTELKAMVTGIRNIELALSGSGIKEPSKSEIKNMHNARKSIIAKKNIKKGDLFSEQNLTVKRPGNGISPMEWDRVIGKRAKRNFTEDQLITLR